MITLFIVATIGGYFGGAAAERIRKRLARVSPGAWVRFAFLAEVFLAMSLSELRAYLRYRRTRNWIDLDAWTTIHHAQYGMTLHPDRLK